MADKAFGPTNALKVDEILHQTGDEAVQVVFCGWLGRDRRWSAREGKRAY